MAQDPWQNRWEQPYTDLALEATAALRGASGGEVPGVRMEESQAPGLRIARVEVFSPEGEAALGKAQGRYITLEAPGLRDRDPELQEAVRAALTRELAGLLDLRPETSVLVVGLGNAQATPDALGPRTVRRILVTRHLKAYMPPGQEGTLRPVAAIAPGVLGTTGLETGEVVRGVVQHMRPDRVVVIDALAARSIGRLGTTIQMADTGIQPGSGLGNARLGLTRETLGIPVVAIGVPTVVHAATVAFDTLDLLAREMKGKSPFFDLMAQFGPEERRRLIQEVLRPEVGDLVVTPKEIDDLIDAMARLLARALNDLLHTTPEAQALLRYAGG
ncbi:MAG: GPR endopeptidase [Firmicutes bacterium]|nr:GPR endopeptidase [Bacillota bacterium]